MNSANDINQTVSFSPNPCKKGGFYLFHLFFIIVVQLRLSHVFPLCSPLPHLPPTVNPYSIVRACESSIHRKLGFKYLIAHHCQFSNFSAH